MKKITSSQYANDYAAAVCPVCHSSDISSDPIEMDGSVGTANVQCQDCKSCWTDIIRVVGYENLKEGVNL